MMPPTFPTQFPPQPTSRRKHVILDLDNTLICAEPMESFPFDKPGMKEKALQFQIHDMDDMYIVFERPRLQEFLDYLFANFDVSVWTAASKDYAIFIIEQIVIANRPNRNLKWCFFMSHCKQSTKWYRSTLKKLDTLWERFELSDVFTPDTTLIIDDNKDVLKTNGDKCLAIKAFEILDNGSENDDVLFAEIIPKLEQWKTQ